MLWEKNIVHSLKSTAEVVLCNSMIWAASTQLLSTSSRSQLPSSTRPHHRQPLSSARAVTDHPRAREGHFGTGLQAPRLNPGEACFFSSNSFRPRSFLLDWPGMRPNPPGSKRPGTKTAQQRIVVRLRLAWNWIRSILDIVCGIRSGLLPGHLTYGTKPPGSHSFLSWIHSCSSFIPKKTNKALCGSSYLEKSAN
jgi:hypothetical protein